MTIRTRLSVASALVLFMFVVGCRSESVEIQSSSSSIEDSSSESSRRDKRAMTALKAKDALFAQLSGRLKEVLQSSGPAAAIEVCSQEAVSIAQDVGQVHGVEIGRTSFKLRNPANAPRPWLEPLMERRVNTPQHLDLENGNLGVVYPIHLNVKCLMCHGSDDDILPEVKQELVQRYPDDQATGFAQDDLRGYFWVEVP